jgi:hypothetical protein
LRHVRLPAALLCAVALVVGVLGTAPARAADTATVTIVSPAAADTLFGTISVSFDVSVPAGTAQNYYQVRVGSRLSDRKYAACYSTCRLTFTTDTTEARFPSWYQLASNRQVNDGPQRITVMSLNSSYTVIGSSAVDVVIDNDQPTLGLVAPVVPSGASDGRVTVDRTFRLEAHPAAVADGAEVEDVVVAGGGHEWDVVAPSQPGAPWVIQADPSAWTEGPLRVELSARDTRGVQGAPTTVEAMVVHGFGLSGPAVQSPVYDDDLRNLELFYEYSQYVTNTWPVLIETLVDGMLVNRQTVTELDRALHPGRVLAELGPPVAAGAHSLSFVVTDNRGTTERVDTPLDVRESVRVSWVSGTGQQSRAGRPLTLSASAQTEIGSISSWILENAVTSEILDSRVCNTACPLSQTQAMTFTPKMPGTIDLRLRIGFSPGRPERTLTTTVTVLPAPADFTGDGAPDVLVRDKAGQLLLYRGNGKGGWLGARTVVGKGWQGFDAIVSNGDHSGDLRRDVMARGHAGQMYLYRANGTGGWASGGGEPHNHLIVPGYTVVSGLGDFDGDRLTDIVARDTAGRLHLYRGAGGHVKRTQIGSGWQGFTSVFSPGDFDGDGASDIMARAKDGRLLLYPGNGRGGWAAAGRVVGKGWSAFTAMSGIGDFDGDGRNDVLARHSDGRLLLYRGNGKGGWAAAGYAVGRGWQGFTAVVGVG